MFSGHNRHKPKRKPLLALLCLIVLLSLAACIDPYEYRSSRISPHDFVGSEWQSEDPALYMKVQSDKSIEGTLLLNEEEVKICCSFEWGYSVLITKKRGGSIQESDFILEGHCVCTEQEVVITVTEDYCFDGKYDVIVLTRMD